MLEYVANTLIFVLAGVIISNRVHTSSQGEGAIVHALDYAYALLLWVYLLVRPPGLAYTWCEGASVHVLDYAYALLLWVYLLVRPPGLAFFVGVRAPSCMRPTTRTRCCSGCTCWCAIPAWRFANGVRAPSCTRGTTRMRCCSGCTCWCALPALLFCIGVRAPSCLRLTTRTRCCSGCTCWCALPALALHGCQHAPCLRLFSWSLEDHLGCGPQDVNIIATGCTMLMCAAQLCLFCAASLCKQRQVLCSPRGKAGCMLRNQTPSRTMACASFQPSVELQVFYTFASDS